MSDKTLFKNKTSKNMIRRVIALLLCAVLLSFVGCDETGTSSEGVASGKPAGTTDSTPSGNVSADNGSESEVVDPTTGKITFDSEVKENKQRDDAGEVIAPKNTAGLSTNYVGGADKEAEAMREKILNTGNTEDYYTITGTKYYISPGGNDENSGKSPEEAIRTIDGLNSLALTAGDAVLFERDSIFRLTQTIRTVDGVIYGSYGKGEKPKIYCSPLNFVEANWQPSNRKNIWKTLYTYDEAGGMYFDHGKEIGYMKTSVRSLTENTHFYYNSEDGYMYLYCDKGNPSKAYESIEVATKVSCITIPTGTGATVDNLCLKYAAYFGVQGYFNCKDVVVTNCEIGYIGGVTSGNHRLGNAIQCWQGARGFTVKGCWVYQTFDTAISWQGYGGNTVEYTNIIFEDNLTEYNNCDYELWDNDGAKLGSMSIANNIMRFTALGWGTRINDGGVRGIEGVFMCDTNGLVHVDDTIIKNNIIDCPDRKVFAWDIAMGDWDRYKMSGNKIYWKQEYRELKKQLVKDAENEIVRYCQRNADDSTSVRSWDRNAVLPALQRFDPTIELIWLD